MIGLAFKDGGLLVRMIAVAILRNIHDQAQLCHEPGLPNARLMEPLWSLTVGI